MDTDYKFEQILREVQKPGRYIGKEINAVYKDKHFVKLRFAFCFPDVYEIGMSHLGMKIIYSILNERPEIWCERVFAPWFDMGEQLKLNKYPLFALESRDPIGVFDVIGFTLQYEMSYTNILYILDLAGIPFYSMQRKEEHPLVIGGGPCVCNPEPVADFFDLFVIGEGEEVLIELCYLLIESKLNGYTKNKTLKLASEITGIYVPSFYSVKYCRSGSIVSYMKNAPESKTEHPDMVKKRYINKFNDVEFFKATPVPMIETVHDRTTLEIQRGCIRGCRFCQAGYIYRPLRAKSVETLNAQAREQCEMTGYDEISLLSLSTSDYPQLEGLLDNLLTWTVGNNTNISLPSLRIDNISEEMLNKTTSVRKSGLTFAPEAGSQRMRDIINKNITEEQILSSCALSFKNGFTKVKLYFMIGLPFETDEDIVAIPKLAQKIVDLYYSLQYFEKRKPVEVNVSVSYFVPKPFTPFQYAAQDTVDEFERKQKILLAAVTSKRISISYHDSKTSFIEAVFARGDRKLSGVIESNYNEGSYFDSWGEGFSYNSWLKSFAKHGIDPKYYANRERGAHEIFPWDILDYGLCKAFLLNEYRKAKKGQITEDCKEHCAACGISELTGGECFADSQNSF